MHVYFNILYMQILPSFLLWLELFHWTWRGSTLSSPQALWTYTDSFCRFLQYSSSRMWRFGFFIMHLFSHLGVIQLLRTPHVCNSSCNAAREIFVVLLYLGPCTKPESMALNGDVHFAFSTVLGLRFFFPLNSASFIISRKAVSWLLCGQGTLQMDTVPWLISYFTLI